MGLFKQSTRYDCSYGYCLKQIIFMKKELPQGGSFFLFYSQVFVAVFCIFSLYDVMLLFRRQK